MFNSSICVIKKGKNSENVSISNDASTCIFLQIRYNIEGISHIDADLVNGDRPVVSNSVSLLFFFSKQSLTLKVGSRKVSCSNSTIYTLLAAP